MPDEDLLDVRNKDGATKSLIKKGGIAYKKEAEEDQDQLDHRPSNMDEV